MVMVTDADIRRLVAGTGRAWQHLVRFVPEGAISLEKRSPWWLWLSARRCVVTLRWEGHACAFLGADNRCTVYQQRPVACREHPFSIEHSDSGALVKLTKSRVGRCPNEWDGGLSRRALVALSRQTGRESEAYTKRLREWNHLAATERTRSRFGQFFGLV